MDRALVLKVRVFGTRKWPIIISDGSGRIKVYRPGLYGLNRDRAGRSAELLCLLFTRSYFTLASVVMKDIMVQFRKANFVKTEVQSYSLLVGISFSEDFGGSEAM